MAGMKITLDSAMRARDVSRPQAHHEESAQRAAEAAPIPPRPVSNRPERTGPPRPTPPNGAANTATGNENRTPPAAAQPQPPRPPAPPAEAGRPHGGGRRRHRSGRRAGH